MKGDFSRLTFDPAKHFTAVLMQQGRVQVDADWNEQAAILRHYLERLAADLIGPFGGPAGDALGFKIGVTQGATGAITGLTVGAGRYYVDGLLAENPAPASITLAADTDPSLLVYLDVWQRLVTAIEDESIREVALEGPDTATRAQLVWQVRETGKLPAGHTTFPQTTADFDNDTTLWADWVEVFEPANRGSLKARAKRSGDPTDPCVASPDAGFHGLDNRLYRVEIQRGGAAGEAPHGATFKWSRDNGSIAFAIVSLVTDSGTKTTTVTLENLGNAQQPAVDVEDWVEIADDDVALDRAAGPLLQVAAVDADRRQVTLAGLPAANVGRYKAKHPLLRRWDQHGPAPAQPGQDGGPLLVEGALLIAEGKDQWFDLEDGIQVSFQPAAAGKPNRYLPGDYWVIPARTATGDVEWPQTPATTAVPAGPAALPPRGVRHRFAPLALAFAGKNPQELRKSFKGLAIRF
jgi:hypothetical protein